MHCAGLILFSLKDLVQSSKYVPLLEKEAQLWYNTTYRTILNRLSFVELGL